MTTDAPTRARYLALRYSGWGMFAVFVIYPLSIIPAAIALAWLLHWGIDLRKPFELFYAPVIWAQDNVDWVRRIGDVIGPQIDRLVPR